MSWFVQWANYTDFYNQSAKLVKYFGFEGDVDVEILVKELLKKIQMLFWNIK